MTDIEYLPYKAINVFINHEYLEQLLESVLKGYNKLPKQKQIAFVKQFRQHVNVLGFRNAIRAPLSLQINAYISAFEEKNDVVPFTLSTWAELNPNLASEVENWLEAEGWNVLNRERDFIETEGFLANWPSKLTYDKLVKNFKKAKPNVKHNRDDLILMVLWISGKLPPELSDI
ncbi:MAG: hypothetical protein U9R53_01850 [Chloroflexota bacterium]|nr:hypothetical protein [Chloroflexota bacterium]